MSKTASYDELLTVCIQDLHKGEVMLADALSGLSGQANHPALARLFDAAKAGADEAAGALTGTGRHKGGTENLWMKGIVDDAQRDTRSIEAGPLLDAAMIGAVRKAKAAQIVSYDTAIAVAAALDQREIGEMLIAVRKGALSINTRLKRRLP